MVGKSSSTEELEKKEEDQEQPEHLRLHQMVVRRIGEICRIVNQVRIHSFLFYVIVLNIFVLFF